MKLDIFGLVVPTVGSLIFKIALKCVGTPCTSGPFELESFNAKMYD